MMEERSIQIGSVFYLPRYDEVLVAGDEWRSITIRSGFEFPERLLQKEWQKDNLVYLGPL